MTDFNLLKRKGRREFHLSLYYFTDWSWIFGRAFCDTFDALRWLLIPNPDKDEEDKSS
jgi:hypothetical protein